MATKKTRKSGERGRRSDRPSTRKQRAVPREPASAVSSFPIVGLGASAGGLGALEDFFSKLQTPSGAAYVIVVHQQSGHPRLLSSLLQRNTDLPVYEVGKPVRVRPDAVYVAPADRLITIDGGVIRTIVGGAAAHPPMPIDFFFRALARDQKERAIGIVLSGTGSDGTNGLREIKSELGIAIAQDEQTASYPAMPKSAIATRLVDHVLAPQEMGPLLLTHFAELRRDDAPALSAPAETLKQIFVLVRSRTGHDFSQYKISTVRRRIERRMHLHRLETVKDYVRHLQKNPLEIDLLFKEMLIGVTSFFRDPEAWETLGESLVEYLADKPDDYVMRGWVPGCSTGEEAYSLAIVLRESMDSLKRTLSVQIFATDLDADAIEVGRAGVYPLGIANDVSPRRLARFFTREKDCYRVKKEIREWLIFAPQNVIANPPFTKRDILSCRNLLIYLDAEVQKRLFPLFHYALRPGGLLMLGSSESVGAFADMFSTVDKKAKIFRREEVPAGRYPAEFPANRPEPIASPARPLAPRAPTEPNVGHLADRLLLKDLVPPTVLVQERGEVVHIHGRTGLLLEPAEGPQTAANIFNMAREGLELSLASAMRQAAGTDGEIVHRGVQVSSGAERATVDLRVQRIREPLALKGLYRITFDNLVRAGAEGDGAAVVVAAPPDRVIALERELQFTKESHQATIEELETANEELKSTNEELQSTNEELQSANEELETSKEEMQSLNEELQTVNAQLQGKVEELSRANNDMKNLLNGTDIATIFVDDELNIQRYTDQARKVIRLIPSDIGRPIGDLVSTLKYDHLLDDAREVMRTLVFCETEVQSETDAWYLMRILPYRTTENVIDGLVLTFVDITKVRSIREGQRRLVDVLKNSPTSVFGCDLELRYRWSADDVFGLSLREVEGKSDSQLFGAKAGRELTALKRRAIQTRSPAREMVTLSRNGKTRRYDVWVEPVRGPGKNVLGVACVATELSQP